MTTPKSAGFPPARPLPALGDRRQIAAERLGREQAEGQQAVAQLTGQGLGLGMRGRQIDGDALARTLI